MRGIHGKNEETGRNGKGFERKVKESARNMPQESLPKEPLERYGRVLETKR